MASPVCDPWPISDLSTVSVTTPSVPMLNHALGENDGAAAGRKVRSAMPDGRWKAMTRPAAVSTNSRRVIVELMACSSTAWCVVCGCRRRNQPLTTHHAFSFSGHLPDRQLPDPFPGRREDRVAHGRRDRRRPGLSDAPLRVGARHDVHLDHRHFGEAQHPVVVEIALLHPALVDPDLTPQRGGETVHDRALHLRFDDARVHDRPAVHRAHHAVHAHVTVRYRDLRYLGDVAVERLPYRDAARAAL